MTTQCCICKKVRVGNRWQPPHKVTTPPNNTYCPACFQRSMRELRSEQRALRQTAALASHDGM